MLVMPGYSPEQAERLVRSAIQFSELDRDFTKTELWKDAGGDNSAYTTWFNDWGPRGPKMLAATKDGWKTSGKRQKLTTTGIMLFKNKIGNAHFQDTPSPQANDIGLAGNTSISLCQTNSDHRQIEHEHSKDQPAIHRGGHDHWGRVFGGPWRCLGDPYGIIGAPMKH